MTSLDPVTTSPVGLVTVTEDKDRKVTQLDLIFHHGVTVTQDKVCVRSTPVVKLLIGS